MMNKNALFNTKIFTLSLYFIFIIIINYTELILAEKVLIRGLPDQGLSTDIEYAIYWPGEKKCARYKIIEGSSGHNDYMEFDTSDGLSYCDVNNKDNFGKEWRWKIEKNPDPYYVDNQYYYGLRNEDSKRYLSYKNDDIQGVYYNTMSEAEDSDLYFVGYENEIIEGLPKVGLETIGSWRFLYVDKNDHFNIKHYRNKNGDIVNRPEESAYFVFIPLTSPKACENITYNQPPSLETLTLIPDQINTIEDKNYGSKEKTVGASKTICNDVTTKWTRISGSGLTFGYTISYSTPEVLGAQAKSEYVMQMTYHQSNSFEWEEKNTICQTTNGDIVCPPRTICRRDVTSYVPPTKSIPMTIEATCDSIKYTVESEISVEGWVYTKILDTWTPTDCPHYTNVYGDLGEGRLPFCDTCNNNQECEICRDGYLLLDGVCITAYVCDDICGGEIRGEGSEGVHDEIPWSGGWCAIKDETKHQSDECGEALGK